MSDSSFLSDAPLLSLVVITKDEADRIAKLLDSASIADEVVVVDSGSSDATVELCRSRGARVVHHDWQGYAAQKQFALETAQGEWVLNLDADEALSDELAEEVHTAIRSAGPDVGGFSMPRLSRYLNRWIRHGGWYPDRKVRLVRKGHGHWVGDGLHETLLASGTVKDLEHPLLHYVYRDISDQVIHNQSFFHGKCGSSQGFSFKGLSLLGAPTCCWQVPGVCGLEKRSP